MLFFFILPFHFAFRANKPPAALLLQLFTTGHLRRQRLHVLVLTARHHQTLNGDPPSSSPNFHGRLFFINGGFERRSWRKCPFRSRTLSFLYSAFSRILSILLLATFGRFLSFSPFHYNTYGLLRRLIYVTESGIFVIYHNLWHLRDENWFVAYTMS